MFAKQSDFAAVTVEFKSKDLSDAIEPNARESAIYAVSCRKSRTQGTNCNYS